MTLSDLESRGVKGQISLADIHNIITLVQFDGPKMTEFGTVIIILYYAERQHKNHNSKD